MAKRSTRLIFRLVLLLLSLSLAALLLEWILTTYNLFGVNYPGETLRYRVELTEPRWKKPDGTWDLDGVLFQHKPGATAEFSSFSVKLNSLGFRGPEVPVEKKSSTYRILILGDSVTFGWGVDDDKTFVRLLEKSLNDRFKGMQFEVVNCGHLFFDTVQEVKLFEEKGPRLKPDLVILVFVINDLDPTRDVVEAFFGLKPPKKPVGATDPSIYNSIKSTLSRWFPSISILLDHVITPVPEAYKNPEAVKNYAPEKLENGKRGWGRCKSALSKLKALCKANKARLLILDNTIPPIRSLPEFCSKNKINMRDFKWTLAEMKMPIFNSAIDSHANALGHRLMLKKLFKALKDEGILQLFK